MWGVLYVQIVLFKLQDFLMFYGFSFWKFVMKSFVLLKKKQVALPEKLSAPLITL